MVGGYLAERSLSIADGEAVQRAIMLVSRAEDAAARYFDQLLRFHRSKRGSAGRLRPADVDEFENPLSPALRDLAIRLRSLRDNVKSEQDRFELASFAKRAADLGLIADALITQSLGARAEEGESSEPQDAGAGESATPAPPAYVYWIEVEGDSRAAPGGSASAHRFGPRVTIACAPVDVAPLLRQHLFDPRVSLASVPLDEGGDGHDAAGGESEFGSIAGQPPTPTPTAPTAPTNPANPATPATSSAPSILRPSVTLTSATLATRSAKSDEPLEHAESAFSHLINNLGLPQPPDLALLQLGSPFDYASQAQLVIDLTVPNPRGGGNADGYNQALAARILHHVRATDGYAFVLFTAFSTLNACASILRPKFDQMNMALFAQGVDGPRPMILKRFVESPRSVLFGAASFWQGVDVRGDQLRNVIITRLPFEPPDRPITQARNERLEAQGLNPFMYDSLPRAIIRFKQGFGRLIRSATDSGRVVVLDPRIATTGYGKRFVGALPPGVPVSVVEPNPEDEAPPATDWDQYA